MESQTLEQQLERMRERELHWAKGAARSIRKAADLYRCCLQSRTARLGIQTKARFAALWVWMAVMLRLQRTSHDSHDSGCGR